MRAFVGRCQCGFDGLERCPRHKDMSPIELAAAEALYADRDIEVGREGIGGFCAGQAEETILALRNAGFRLTLGE